MAALAIINGAWREARASESVPLGAGAGRRPAKREEAPGNSAQQERIDAVRANSAFIEQASKRAGYVLSCDKNSCAFAADVSAVRRNKSRARGIGITAAPAAAASKKRRRRGGRGGMARKRSASTAYALKHAERK